MTVTKNLIENVKDLKKALNEISVYDLDVYTTIELYYKITQKLNEVIKELSRFEGVVSDEIIEQNNKLQWLVNNGLKTEIVNKVNQMLQDGSLAEILNEDVFNNKVDKKRNKVVFMPVDKDTEQAPGDCSLVMTKTGKTILIDTGAEESYCLINNTLQNEGVTKIDYVIISHYHRDHCGNLAYLKRDFDMTNTVYYLQKHTDNFNYGDDFVIGQIGSNSKIYPNSGDTLIVDDLKFTFFNCNQGDIDYYNANSSNYNDYSMCCYLENENNVILFTGDINLKAQARLIDLNWFRKVDLLKVEHHAYDSTVNNDYIRKVNPKYAVVSESEKALSTKITAKSETLSLMNALGTDVAWCGKETIRYYFNEFGGEFVHNYSVGGTFKDTGAYTLIYLDETFTGVSDGTFKNPFRTLTEALSEIPKLNSLNIQIVPKNGSFTSDEHIRVVNLNGTLKLDNITVRGFDIRNSNVILGDVTVTNTNPRAMVIDSSIVEFNNLTLNGDVRNADTEYNGRGLTIYKSKVTGTTLNISNKRIALASYNCSDVYIGTLTGTNNEYGIVCNGGSQTVISKSSMTFVTNIKDLDKTSKIDGVIKNDFTGYLNTGDDLNNFKTIGNRYVAKTGAITSSLLNKPTGLGYSFSLEIKKVTEDGSIMQIIKSRHLNAVNVSNNKTGIFIRTFNSTDNWSNWFEITLK